MKALLDTNVFLWCIAGEKSRFSRRAARVLANEDTQLVLSVVSLWEIALKVQAGKLEIPLEKAFFQEQIGLLGVHSVLTVEPSHLFALFGLPDHHRDPFDRLLVAQSIAERLPLIASDAAFKRYPVEIVW